MPKLRKRKPRITTQKDLVAHLKKLKPRYRIRVPLRDRRGPFLIQLGTDVAGNVIKIRESVFLKIRKRNKIVLVNRVNNSYYCYEEYSYGNNRNGH